MQIVHTLGLANQQSQLQTLKTAILMWKQSQTIYTEYVLKKTLWKLKFEFYIEKYKESKI